MNHINFEAKTDRELLILVAQQGNETNELAKDNKKKLGELNDICHAHANLIQIQAKEIKSLQSYIIKPSMWERFYNNKAFVIGAMMVGAIVAILKLKGWLV